MALLNQTKPAAAPAFGNNKPADAFLNIAVVGKDGVSHNMRSGIALYASNKLDAAIINKFATDPEATLELTVVSVRANTANDDSVIEL